MCIGIVVVVVVVVVVNSERACTLLLFSRKSLFSLFFSRLRSERGILNTNRKLKLPYEKKPNPKLLFFSRQNKYLFSIGESSLHTKRVHKHRARERRLFPRRTLFLRAKKGTSRRSASSSLVFFVRARLDGSAFRFCFFFLKSSSRGVCVEVAFEKQTNSAF